jgi:hypothetical protein
MAVYGLINRYIIDILTPQPYEQPKSAFYMIKGILIYLLL